MLEEKAKHLRKGRSEQCCTKSKQSQGIHPEILLAEGTRWSRTRKVVRTQLWQERPHAIFSQSYDPLLTMAFDRA